MQLQNLNTQFLGRDFYYYETLDSTQSEIYRKIENNTIKNGTLILAKIQNNGMGTHGRKWFIEEEGNITFSFFVQTNCKMNKLEGLTLKIAKIILEVFKKIYGIELCIKLPNDITYNGKKIGGILTVSKSQEDIIKYLVIGIGINTNGKKFNGEIEKLASSIKNEFNIEIDNQKVISEFCNLFEKEIIQRIEG